MSALRSFGLAFEDVAAGEFLEAVDFVPGFFGVPLEFGGHEGGDVLGTRAGMGDGGGADRQTGVSYFKSAFNPRFPCIIEVCDGSS